MEDFMDKNWEIPDAMRDLAEQNVRQARSAYDQFTAAARQAQIAATASGETMAATAREIQQRLMQYAEQNSESGLAMASDLAKARNLETWASAYQQHIKRQSETYMQQAQELGRLIAASQGQRL
jgi:hypothetical protein